MLPSYLHDAMNTPLAADVRSYYFKTTGDGKGDGKGKGDDKDEGKGGCKGDGKGKGTHSKE